MTVELLQTLSMVCYIVGILFLGISLLLFFVLHVPGLVGDLSGATARRAIESIRQQNNEEESGRRVRRGRTGKSVFQTEKFTTSRLQASKVEETTILTPETTALAPEITSRASETTVLEPETTVLAPETTILTSETTVPARGTADKEVENWMAVSAERQCDIAVSVEVDIGFCESTEAID
ncbi:MAG: hypothetical protein ACI4AD_10130 [Roseburia sp.]